MGRVGEPVATALLSEAVPGIAPDVLAVLDDAMRAKALLRHSHRRVAGGLLQKAQAVDPGGAEVESPLKQDAESRISGRRPVFIELLHRATAVVGGDVALGIATKSVERDEVGELV